MRPEFVVWKLGESIQHRPLDACAVIAAGSKAAPPAAPRFMPEWDWILLLGAVHGDEIEGVWLLEELRERWTKDFPFQHVGVVIWSQVNPDGVALGQRWNASNIDLNRNLPSRDWTPEIKNPRYPPGASPASEPENKALVSLIERLKPRAILSAHSFANFQVNVNGPSREWAETIAPVCGYPITEDIGYPTPGSLGVYAGKERNIPTITLEIERGLAREKVLALHAPVVEQAVRFWDQHKERL